MSQSSHGGYAYIRWNTSLGEVRSFTPTTGLSRMIILNLRVPLRSPGKPGMIVPILVKSIIHCNGEPHIGTANTCSQRYGCLNCERVLLVRQLASSSAADLCIGGGSDLALPCRLDST
jgi:hypothetical protein